MASLNSSNSRSRRANSAGSVVAFSRYQLSRTSMVAWIESPLPPAKPCSISRRAYSSAATPRRDASPLRRVPRSSGMTMVIEIPPVRCNANSPIPHSLRLGNSTATGSNCTPTDPKPRQILPPARVPQHDRITAAGHGELQQSLRRFLTGDPVRRPAHLNTSTDMLTARTQKISPTMICVAAIVAQGRSNRRYWR